MCPARAEELGVRPPVRPVLTFLCHGAISPYWWGVHEAVVTGRLTPDAGEIAWHGWLDPDALRAALRAWRFVPDSRDAFALYSRASSTWGGRASLAGG